MKLTYDIIKDRSKKAKLHPLFNKIKDDVSSITGVDAHQIILDDNFPSEDEYRQNEKFLIISLSPEDLLDNGTQCGTVGNKCFNQKVVNFLKQNGVTEIFTIASSYDSGLPEGSPCYALYGATMKLNKRKADQLSNLIGRGDGSWRADVGHARGWSSFETE